MKIIDGDRNQARLRLTFYWRYFETNMAYSEGNTRQELFLPPSHIGETPVIGIVHGYYSGARATSRARRETK
jgi:hypothetical protein